MGRILPILVVSQFFCTSVWFASNAIMPDLAQEFPVGPFFFAYLTSAIQFGFISGTLFFAIFTIADRFSPSFVFFTSSLLAAICNFGITLPLVGPNELLLIRFLTGFFLAGVYPVGMKIASDYYESGLGRSLGYLVGALVLGTAFPHLLKTLTQNLPWKGVMYATSSLSVLGGLAVYLWIPDGPYRRPSQIWHVKALFQGFQRPRFRSVSFGYFGHMWELYAFWAFIPSILATYSDHFSIPGLNIARYSFIIIASGSISCVVGGHLAQRWGIRNVAIGALSLSGLCCLVSPLVFLQSSPFILILFLVFWGMAVIADSPLFSTLVAQNAPEESRGTSLTIANCLGFAITIVSIQFIQFMAQYLEWRYTFLLLGLGPLLGLYGLYSQESNLKKG